MSEQHDPQDKALWGGRFEGSLAPEVLALSRSIHFDRRLGRYEVACTRAHAAALERAGLLSEGERKQIDEALDEAARAFDEGTFYFDPADEDVHSGLERFLIERLDDVGRKIHAGRSRNDLVAAGLRMWVKDAVRRIARGVHELEGSLYRQARDNEDVLASGYTHLQRAQPVLLPHLLLAHLFALARDFERLVAAYRRADVSPLGAAALAGSTLGLDARATAADAGFSRVFDNAADAVADRDFAMEFLAASAILAVHLSRLGEEIVLWTSSEFGFAALDDAYATGSSIMPQKKNPDVAELVRAKSARVTADLVHLLGAMKGLPLAYNRDMQEDKEPVFDAADSLEASLPALTGLISTMRFDRERLAATVSQGVLATDLAEALVARGVPFRLAHEEVGAAVAKALAEGIGLEQAAAAKLGGLPGYDPGVLEVLDARRAVQARSTHGGTSPARISEQFARAEAIMDDQERWLAGYGAH